MRLRREQAGDRREAITGYLFIAPALALFALLGVYTVAYGLRLSFVEWNGFSPTRIFVGLDNFKDLLWADAALSESVRAAVGRTLVVMVAAVIPTVLISLPLAIALNSVGRLRGFLQTLYFLPYVTTGIAVFYAWRFILLPDGGLNSILTTIGLGSLAQAEGFLGNPDTALWATTAVLVWSTVPIGVLLYLSGLQSIDGSLLEAARLDGASPLRIATTILWPLLRPITALLVALVLRAVLQEFQVFLLMTNGGPLDKTTTVSLLTYNLAFGNNAAYGYAAALGWLLFAFSLALAAAAFFVLRRKG
ncbi:MAG TPA: sugar ABC transporter permease [Conexibacter sp.]|nr:sugar ABC transporter permease [Conexibacter sp.]